MSMHPKRQRLLASILSIFLVAFTAWYVTAQVPSPSVSTPVQLVPAYYATIPISATSTAVNTQATLTIPAPASNLYNYVCSLAFDYSNSATTGTVQTNQVTTSTNFNSFAIKYSLPVGVNTTYDWNEVWGTPAGGGCARSAAPGTATTFVSPAISAQGMYTWYAVYFQGP